MVYKNEMKAKLRSGKPVFGCIVTAHVPDMVEMIGLAGFDFVFIDAEHGPLSVSDCQELIRCAEVRRLVPIVRVLDNSPAQILRHLDVGAMGIVVPHVDSAEQARDIVRAAKFHPLGVRGLASARSADYGMTKPSAEYYTEANRETMVFPQVESQEAVRDAARILSVEGVDGVLLGTGDLSQSLGIPGKPNDPRVLAEIALVVEAAKAAGKAVGAMVRPGESPRLYVERGMNIVLVSAWSLFRQAIKAFVESTQSS